MKVIFFLLFISIVLGGCAGSRTFDGVALSSIQPGVSTEQDVRELMGSPTRQVFNEEYGRNESIVYRTFDTSSNTAAPMMSGYSGTAGAAQTETERKLYVYFDENGVVTHHQIRRGSSRR